MGENYPYKSPKPEAISPEEEILRKKLEEEAGKGPEHQGEIKSEDGDDKKITPVETTRKTS